MDTAIHLDLTLMQQLPLALARNRVANEALEPFVDTPVPVSGSPFINPIRYQAIAAYNVPRSLLPPAGLFWRSSVHISLAV
jgi:hypothetical protein